MPVRCPNCGGPHPRWDCRVVVPAMILPAGYGKTPPQASAPPAKSATPPAQKRASPVAAPTPMVSAPADGARVSTYAPPGACPHCDQRRAEAIERVRKHRAARSE